MLHGGDRCLQLLFIRFGVFYCLQLRTKSIVLLKHVAAKQHSMRLFRETGDAGKRTGNPQWCITSSLTANASYHHQDGGAGHRLCRLPFPDLHSLRFALCCQMSVFVKAAHTDDSRHGQVKSDKRAIRSGLSLHLECLTPLLSPPYSTATVHRCSLRMHLH